MKATHRRLARTALAAASLGFLYACARKDWNADNAFVVLDVNPDVKTLRAKELSWKPASPSDLMRPNDKLQTFAGASATIGLKNDQQLFVRELTLLVFGDYDKDDARAKTTGTLQIESGRVETRTLDAARRDDMSFRTQNSAVTVGRKADEHGGYDLVIDAGADDKLSVLTGTAAVSAQGETVGVPENFGTMVKKGQKPQPPRPLPSAPILVAADGGEFFRADEYEGVPLEWLPSSGAASYRIVVSPDAAFTRVLQEQGTGKPPAYARGLKAGTYHWRASATDDDGLESRPSAEQSFTIAAKVFPELTRPPDGRSEFLARRRDIGKRHYVGGYVRRPDLGDVDVVVYALVDAWYLQWYPYAPLKPRPATDPDGYWEMRVNGGTRYKAYLVPKGAAKLPDFRARREPPKVDGRLFLAETDATAP
jgi:hypothetical protein